MICKRLGASVYNYKENLFRKKRSKVYGTDNTKYITSKTNQENQVESTVQSMKY